MTYSDFYEIAKFMNKYENNFFTEKGVACNAYDYLMSYEKVLYLINWKKI